jgi:hypothetical protein
MVLRLDHTKVNSKLIVNVEASMASSYVNRACRDCGYIFLPADRGCPECALNLEAEAMIDRFVWRRFVPGVVVAALLAGVLLYYFLR